MRRNLAFLLLWILAIGILSLAMPGIIQHYAATDNVRELFRADAKFGVPAHVWFLTLCLLVPATASLAARLLLGRRIGAALVLLAVSPVAGWFCLRFAVTVESIHDILGAPILRWPYDLEYIMRFSCVFCTLWLITLLGFLPGLWSAQAEARSRDRIVTARLGSAAK